MDIIRQRHKGGLFPLAAFGGVLLFALFLWFLVFILWPYDEFSSERNGVDQRNHRRDRIECEAKGGLLGGPARDVTCFDVDSIIPLVGVREKYKG